MKRIMRVLVSLGLLMILGVACQSTNTPIASVTPESSINWWTSWLAQPVCKPPCWANITPGETSLKDALSILEKIPEITITFKSQDGIDWQFKQPEDGAGTLSAKNGVISFIRVGVSPEKQLNLKEVVTTYGYPDYVKPYDCREGMCSTILIYPESGLFLGVFIRDTGTVDAPEIEILPETIVKSAYFFQPGLENFQKLIAFQDNNLPMEWKGYGEYP